MLEFRALGPIEVLRDGQPIDLGKGRERVLLAALVVAAGQPLSTDELLEALWGTRYPTTAVEMVRNYVGRLRVRLGDGVVATTPGGYRLAIEETVIDISRFEQLAEEGIGALEHGDPERAAEVLRSALALWRGRPVPELDETRSYQPRLAALEELHLRVEEERSSAELALGHAPAVIPELEDLVEQHPYRERLIGRLMLALYRSGRQKDALDVYASSRRRLVGDVGLEPGPELRDLQSRILRQDPSLSEIALPSPLGRSAEPRRHLVTLGVVTLGVVTLVAVVGATAVFAFHSRTKSIAIPRRGVVALDAASGKPVQGANLPVLPGPVAVNGEDVWVASRQGPSIFALRASRGEPRRVHVAATPFALAVAGNSLWVADGYAGTLNRVDADGNVLASFRPQPRAAGRLPLAGGASQLWIGSQDGTLTRLDPKTTRRQGTYAHVGLPQAIAVGEGSVWIAAATADVVERFDPLTGRVVRRIPVGGRPSLLVSGGGAIWALTPTEDRLWRIDPNSDAVNASVGVPSDATSLAVAPHFVWIGSASGLLTTVDASSNSVVRSQSLNRPIDGLAAADGRLWVTVG